MKRNILELLSSKRGFTLLEILASIVIVAIILGPFIHMFVQSAAANKLAYDMVDATYEAQEHMENMYSLSQQQTYSSTRNTLINDGYAEVVIAGGQDYRYSKAMNGYYVVIELRDSAYEDNLVQTIVQIYNNSSLDRLEAQMENILSWEM